ncbi:hypothetical protein [Flavobacterium sp.]
MDEDFSSDGNLANVIPMTTAFRILPIMMMMAILYLLLKNVFGRDA